MKLLLKDANAYLIRFDTGEEVMGGLKDFCTSHAIFAGNFSALGAAKKVIVAYYDLEKKIYIDTVLNEDVEIVGVTGNIATKDGAVAVHGHGSFSNKTAAATSGHIKELVVSATCEVTLFAFKGKLVREPDEKTGLNLLASVRCQSCGMPLPPESTADEYCSFCWKDEKFTQPDLTLEGMIAASIEYMTTKMNFSKEDAEAMSRKILPGLRRWKKV